MSMKRAVRQQYQAIANRTASCAEVLRIPSEGWLRTDPGMLAEAGGLDGFFVARWRT